MVLDTEIAAEKQLEQNPPATRASPLRAACQRGARREVKEGNGRAYTVDERRPRNLPLHECCHLGCCHLGLHGCI
jgi:hypothetical protein